MHSKVHVFSTRSCRFFSATCVWESCRSLSVFFQQKRRENSHLVLIFFQQHVFGKAVEAFPFFFSTKRKRKFTFSVDLRKTGQKTRGARALGIRKGNIKHHPRSTKSWSNHGFSRSNFSVQFRLFSVQFRLFSVQVRVR